jgi:putative transposase
MPYDLRRYQQAESLHFITFSCYHRLPHLAGADAKAICEQLLERMRKRHQLRVYAYVLMPEHVHVLTNEPPGILLAQVLKGWKQQVSKSLKGDRTKFWQDRYYDMNLRGEGAMTETIRYIHRNPVKRGLVERPEDYRWSSFGHYATGVRGAVEIESEWTAQWRERSRAEERVAETRSSRNKTAP